MAETEQTRITRFGGNPTTYNNNSARILKGRDVTVLRPEGGVEHRMYDDGTMTRVDDRTGESIPVPAEYDAYWRDAFEQAQTNARPNLLQRGVHWVGRGIEKAGNWLQRFENGGTAQQPESNKQKRMKELMLIINGAAKELSTKQPGDNVAYLAQVIQDPQEAELIDAIIAEIPDAQEVIDQVSQLSSQMFKCGGKTKKKVKKGAKGCVPCKKLMKIGGRLTNVLVDCEGNIIKHATGGWIRKGNIGLDTQSLFSQKYKTAAVDAPTNGVTTHFYMNQDGTLQQQNWNAQTKTWDTVESVNMDQFNQFARDNSDMFVQGFQYDPTSNSGYFSNEIDAKAALGNAYNSYNVTGKTYDGLTGGGNRALGYTGDGSVTVDQYVAAKGGWQNAMQAQDDILKAKRRASRKLQRQNVRLSRQDGYDGYNTTVGDQEVTLTGNAARKAIRNDQRQYRKDALDVAVDNKAAILNKQMPKKVKSIPTPVQGYGAQTTDTQTRLAKQGGWLTKFENGGVARFESPWKKLEKVGKWAANWLGLAETRTEETRSPELTEEYISYDPLTHNTSYLSPETYRRVITSYKVPGLSNDTAHYILPGTYAVETPGGIIGKTTYYPTVDGYTQQSWDPIRVETGSDDIYYPASEAEKFKHMWYSLPRFRRRGTLLGSGGDQVKIHDYHNDGQNSFLTNRKYSNK